MKTTPYITCTSCGRILELDELDLLYVNIDRQIERLPDQVARPDCPCRTRLVVPAKLANDLLSQMKKKPDRPLPAAPPPPESPGRRKKTDEEKREDAVAAQKAVEEHGTQKAAADALGVSITTIRNRLNDLETLEKVSDDDK